VHSVGYFYDVQHDVFLFDLSALHFGQTLRSSCGPDDRWHLSEYRRNVVTAALTVTHRKIEERKVGREEEMKAEKYKL
jgi:hypothetical protein